MKPKAPKKKDTKPNCKTGEVRVINPYKRPKNAKHKDWKNYTLEEFNNSDDPIRNWISYEFTKEMRRLEYEHQNYWK